MALNRLSVLMCR